MAIQNPFSFSRLGGIMNQPKGNFSGLFNPMQDTSENPYQQGGIQNKRLLTSVIPKRSPDLSLQGNASSPASPMQEDDDSLYDPKFVSDFQNKLMEFNQPGPGRTAYMEAVKNVPTPEEYGAGKWRRFAAALGGGLAGLNQGAGAGVQTADFINTSPYRSALESYQNRTAGLGEIAGLESQDQQNAMKAFTSAVDVGMTAQNKKLDRRVKRSELEINIAKENREYEKTMAEIDRLYAQTDDDAVKRQLEAQQHQETARHNKTLEGIQGGQLEVARDNLGVNQFEAETGRENAITNRGQLAVSQANSAENQRRKAPEQDKAEQMALAELFRSNEFPGAIQVNQGEFGPVYTVNERGAGAVNQRIQQRKNEILGQSMPGYQSNWIVGTPQQWGGR